jgi:pimeloyl-ACP methyl ester carboxylesterase
MMRNNRDFQIAHYLRRRVDHHPPRLAFSAKDRQAWGAWRAELWQKLHDLLAPWPEPVPLSPAIARISDQGDHWREEIVLSSHADMSVPCFLLRPKNHERPGPAILALHGHGQGKTEVVGLSESKARQGYGLEMVRAGYVVFTLDFFPFGARRESDKADLTYDYCNYTLCQTLLWGYNLLTLNLFDVFRAIDYLETRPEVDAQRIGVMGLSYGGTTSMYAAILEHRIKAAVLSCSLGDYRGHGIEGDDHTGTCGAQVVPGILQWAEMGDVAGLLAPKPLLTESARNDGCFTWPYTEPTLARLQEVYAVAGVEDHLIVKIYEDGHRYYGEGVIEFWDRFL